MEITMLQTEITMNDLIEFSGTLSAEEASELARGAYLRIARALHIDESEARKRARDMLTDMELGVLMEETVKARATDRAIRELDAVFLLAPSIQSISPYKEGAPFSFAASLYAVPAMNLDLDSPIQPSSIPRIESDCPAASESKTHDELEKLVLRALRARLTGTISASLESAAIAFENSSFQKELEKNGETFREYRIRTGKKAQDVEADLRRRAIQGLHEEIALETIRRNREIAITPEDEQNMLSSMAPGRESDLRIELDNAGKLWMLSRETRRKAALRWAIENLIQ